LTFLNDVDLLAERHPVLTELLNETKNLDKAFRFLESVHFPVGQMELVSQDEFSLDVCIPFPEGANYLVIGVT